MKKKTKYPLWSVEQQIQLNDCSKAKTELEDKRHECKSEFVYALKHSDALPIDLGNKQEVMGAIFENRFTLLDFLKQFETRRRKKK